MKKQLKEELIHLAEKIVDLKQKEQFSAGDLKKRAQELYEKLCILDFTEKNLNSFSSEEKSVEVEKEKPVAIESSGFEEDEYPDGTQYNTSEAITEPNTEKIKDIVAQMPLESHRVDEIVENLHSNNPGSNIEEIGGVHYDKLPQFEPINSRATPEKPKSLNDRLRNSIQIGINERQAFVKHLFEGSNTDFNRVLSQLNTIKSKDEAVKFVLQMVKPDYNNWEGKEEYEERFLDKVQHKFE